jgi:class 3 adenylate cyclase
MGQPRRAQRPGRVGRHGKLAIEDRGDGMIVLVPASVSKVDLLDPFIPSLVTDLRAHNALVDPALRIRLRVAIHAGEVHRATPGWVGTDLNLACRLVDGQPLYLELARCPSTDLVLVVSTLIHEAVVRHAYRTIDPAAYLPVRVVLKEVDVPAWLLNPTADPATIPHRRVRVPSVTHGVFEQ